MRSKSSGSKARRKKFEFSKVMALIAVAMWIVANFFSMAMVVFTLDTSPLMYVIPSVDAVVAVVVAYYYWKAKAENQIKLRRIYGADAADDGLCDMDADGDMVSTDTAYASPSYESSNIV